MRKFILAVLLLAATLGAFAQRQDYDSGHKYGPFSNIGITGYGLFSYNTQTAKKNAGAGILLTKRIGDYWRLRGLAEVNGFINNGFDRYGKAEIGVSFDLLPFYLYVDYGACYNPSAKQKLGIAADAGAGLQFRLSNVSSLYFEGGYDYGHNVEVKAGYVANLGITERDRQAISIDNNMRGTYGELKQENQLLKSEAKKKEEESAKLQELLERSTAALELATQRLNNCQTEKRELIFNNNNYGVFEPIYFNYAESTLNDFAWEAVGDIAEVINADESDAIYMIEGYCSNNGDPYKNQKLSEERAWSVFNALVYNYGVSSERLAVVGNGMAERDSVREQKVVVHKSL